MNRFVLYSNKKNSRLHATDVYTIAFYFSMMHHIPLSCVEFMSSAS